MKPKIHLNGSLGLLMIGLGIMPVFVIIIESYERYNDGRIEVFSENWQLLSLSVLAIGFLLSGIGLVFKIKKAPFIASAFILMGTLWWSYFVYDEFRFRGFDGPDFWIELSIFIFVYILLFFGLAFLGNDKIRKDYGEIEESHWDDKILDA